MAKADFLDDTGDHRMSIAPEIRLAGTEVIHHFISGSTPWP